jgi:hypothetical protein
MSSRFIDLMMLFEECGAKKQIGKTEIKFEEKELKLGNGYHRSSLKSPILFPAFPICGNHDLPTTMSIAMISRFLIGRFHLPSAITATPSLIIGLWRSHSTFRSKSFPVFIA